MPLPTPIEPPRDPREPHPLDHLSPYSVFSGPAFGHDECGDHRAIAASRASGAASRASGPRLITPQERRCELAAALHSNPHLHKRVSADDLHIVTRAYFDRGLPAEGWQLLERGLRADVTQRQSDVDALVLAVRGMWDADPRNPRYIRAHALLDIMDAHGGPASVADFLKTFDLVRTLRNLDFPPADAWVDTAIGQTGSHAGLRNASAQVSLLQCVASHQPSPAEKAEVIAAAGKSLGQTPPRLLTPREAAEFLVPPEMRADRATFGPLIDSIEGILGSSSFSPITTPHVIRRAVDLCGKVCAHHASEGYAVPPVVNAFAQAIRPDPAEGHRAETHAAIHLEVMRSYLGTARRLRIPATEFIASLAKGEDTSYTAQKYVHAFDTLLTEFGGTLEERLKVVGTLWGIARHRPEVEERRGELVAKVRAAQSATPELDGSPWREYLTDRWTINKLPSDPRWFRALTPLLEMEQSLPGDRRVSRQLIEAAFDGLSLEQGMLVARTTVQDGPARYERALRTTEQLLTSVPSIKARDAVITLAFDSNAQRREEARRLLQYTYVADNPPFEIGGSTARQVETTFYNEIFRTFRRAYERHLGFSSQAFEARRAPGMPDAELARFGLDIGSRIFQLACPDREKFPGTGFVIDGLELANVLSYDRKRPDDPLHAYKHAWPWAADVIEDLALTRQVYARGFVAFTGPDAPRYVLDGCHYSLIFYNDHFHNPKGHAAALVPTAVLDAALAGVCGRYGAEQRAVPPDLEDRFTLEALTAAATARGLNVLNIGSPSNIAGLCNAYPPMSEPYHEWERAKQSYTKDKAGHVHKFYGVNDREGREDRKAFLAKLMEAHDKVYALSNTYFNLHDVSRIVYGIWQKGFALGGESGAEIRLQSPAEMREAEAHPREFMVLRDAYAWHSQRDAGVTAREKFPVLVLMSTHDHITPPQAAFKLDTYDMSLTIGSTRFELPRGSDGGGEEEQALWIDLVRPQVVNRSDLRFRFLSREQLDAATALGQVRAA